MNATSYHGCLLKNDRTLWSAGHNVYGQLGLGDTTNRNVFTKVDVVDVKSVSCGGYCTGLLKKDGTLWTTGWNNYGQLGLGDNTNRNVFTQVDITDVKNIYYGGHYSVLLKNDGTVWSTGYNNFGQLGLGDTTDRTTFTKVDVNDVKSISCGTYHTLILKNDGTLWTTGYNSSGQLGLGDTTARNTFTKIDITDVKSVSCGQSNTLILKNDGTIWGCGNNGNGQLGLGDTTQRNAFTKVDITDVKSISCGSSSTVILKNDGTVWSTGANNDGQLGLGDNAHRTTFTKVDIDNSKEISCGLGFTYILKNDGTVWTTGWNNSGQLGLGDTTNKSTFTKVGIDNVKEFADKITIPILLYLIKTLQSNYTINKDSKTLSEITDVLTAQIIQSKGIDLDTINENINILPDEFSIVSDKEFDLVIHGLKDNEQMIIASNDFLTTIKEHVDYFKSESTTTETSKVKVIFSTDSGLTWKTYQDGVIVDTNIMIPCKAFNLLSVEELQEWNLAKSDILLNGIDSTALETIDFNTIQFDKIRFAYAMSVADIEDSVTLSKLIWQFDSKGYMRQLKNTEYIVKLHADKVEFNSLISTDMIKVNVFPEGMGVSEDIAFATEDEIALLFN